MPSAELRFEAIGAPWRIDTPGPLTASVVAAIHERIERFDATYSRFRSDSLVSRIAREPGVWQFPPDAPLLFDLYRRLYDATDGAMNPLVGDRLADLGYDSSYSLRATGAVTSVPRWEDAIAWDGERLTTVRPVSLDVGAAGKGYLVDLVAEVLCDAGIGQYTVDASGDILHRGDEPLRIALEHPFDPELAIGVYELTDGALCASAPNRRTWGTGLHHIIDAVTGDPTVRVAATWAMASSCLVADGLATALFFAPAAALAPEFDFEYVRMFPDSRAEQSRELQGELFS
jgi:thiamine biosynthesis lipoprotein